MSGPAGPATPVALFLFAHQDDEAGVYECLARAARAGEVTCAYFTDGGGAGADPKVRCAESLDVLGRLGVPASGVHFPGLTDGVPDGRLHEHLPDVGRRIGELLDRLPAEALVYVLAWEGGHPDHDGLHAVAAIEMQARGRIAQLKQFPLYHGFGRRGPFFRVLSPLAANGPTERIGIRFSDRLRQLRHCLRYASQRKTWLGLFPFVLLHMLRRGCQSLQAVDPARLAERPHPGPLYYERRGFLTYAALHEALTRWRAQRP